MVSKQKASLRSERQRDYEHMMDGSVSCIASLQHTELTTHHTPPPSPKKNQEKKKKSGNKSLHTHLKQKITSRGRFKIHKLLVLYTGCLLYSNKRENLISVRRAATKESSESFKAEL